MDNLEKLATQDTQGEEKHNTICVIDTSMRKKTQHNMCYRHFYT